MGKQTITRTELYDLVWSTPFTKLAKKYAISDNGLRKVCRRMEIPWPKSGYWQKLLFNKAGQKLKLSSTYKGDNEVTFSLRKEGDISINNNSSERNVIYEIENDKSLKLIVPDRLTNPHKLIAEDQKILSERDAYYRGGFVGSHNCNFNISVTKPCISRALRFMDTLIKLIERRGHTFKHGNKGGCLVIHDEVFDIYLKEKSKRILASSNYSHQQYEFVPSGLLSFRVRISYHDLVWKDGKLSLEQQLSKIIAKLEIKGAAEREATLIRKKKNEIWEEKERIRKEKEKQIENELKQFKHLRKKALRWQKANLIRAYLNDLEQKIEASRRMNQERKDWFSWAHKKVDWYDPTISTKDELLKGVNKGSLIFKK